MAVGTCAVRCLSSAIDPGCPAGKALKQGKNRYHYRLTSTLAFFTGGLHN